MLTLVGVGFYSNMVVKVFGDATGNVDEVISPRFFFCLLTSIWTVENNSHSIKQFKKQII